MSDSTGDYPPKPEQPAPGVPDFELIRPIGQGGFGQVWLATNQTTGHLRAVKVISLRGSGTRDPAGREITSITRLEDAVHTHHPNLLDIQHVGKTAEHLFYVMEPADDVSGSPASSGGEYRPATLESRLEGGPLGPEECLRYARELLGGLAHLHTAGMVHRDVKPANCLFVGGRLKLADFGLLAEANPQVSRVGTQKYMPPDGRMDTRADVYAAGLVVYELITGLPVESFPRLGKRAQQIAEAPILNRLNRLVL
ncbi:MAG: protein kinase domain-containing protein, partial [Planctomycetota bacterium]